MASSSAGLRSASSTSYNTQLPASPARAQLSAGLQRIRMSKFTAFCGLIVLLGMVTVQAYPEFWAEEYAPSCTSVPTQGKDCHKTPKEDKSIGVTATDASGKVVQTVCPGKPYTISVSFPEARLSFVTMENGRADSTNARNKRCATNAVAFSKKYKDSPSTSFSLKAISPASGSWTIKVASATGQCAPFMVSQASFPIGTC